MTNTIINLSKKECLFLIAIIETQKIKLDSLNLNEKEKKILQEPIISKLLTSIEKKIKFAMRDNCK